MDKFKLTESEQGDFESFGETIGVLTDLFMNGEGTVEGLRMASAVMRRSADVLDAIANRTEQEGGND